MTRLEDDELTLYILNKMQHLENDVIEAQNHMRYRRIDDVDCLEYIVALHRLRAFQEFFRDITWILHLNQKKRRKIAKNEVFASF